MTSNCLKVDVENAFKFYRLLSNGGIWPHYIVITDVGEIEFHWNNSGSIAGFFLDLGFIDGGFSYFYEHSNGNQICKNSKKFDEDELIYLVEIISDDN